MKKQKLTESLENQANLTTKVGRVKQNFRPILFERAGIIAENDKIIASAIRTGIVQILCERLSCLNVDMITILADIIPTEFDPVNFSTIKEKYSVVRDGDFINCGINNLLVNVDKVLRLSKLNIFVYSTDIDSFEVSKDSILIEFTSMDYIPTLSYLYEQIKKYF